MYATTAYRHERLATDWDEEGTEEIPLADLVDDEEESLSFWDYAVASLTRRDKTAMPS